MGPDDGAEPSHLRGLPAVLPDNELAAPRPLRLLRHGPRAGHGAGDRHGRAAHLRQHPAHHRRGDARVGRARQPTAGNRNPTWRPRNTRNAMTTVNTSGRFVGDWPRIGIRPAIDGRQHGRARVAGRADHGHGRGATAELLSANLRHPNGLPVECVIADHMHRRRGRGGAGRRAVRAGGRRRLASPSRPAGATAPRRWTWTRSCPRRSGASTAPSGPGAVYLAAVLAAHNQKGLPAFGIYGRDVQDAGDTTIPADVQEKLLRFARAGLAVADHARQVATCRWAACRWASPARSSTSASSRSTWACASRRSTCPSSSAAWSEGSTTRRNSSGRWPG